MHSKLSISLGFQDKTPDPSSSRAESQSNGPGDNEDFLDFYARISSRRIDSQRGELQEEPICEPDDFSRPSDAHTAINSSKFTSLEKDWKFGGKILNQKLHISTLTMY